MKSWLVNIVKEKVIDTTHGISAPIAITGQKDRHDTSLVEQDLVLVNSVMNARLKRIAVYVEILN